MAVDFLTRELPTLKDPYALALVTYVLHLAENPSRDTAFDMLQAKANNSIEEFRFWAKPRSEKDKTNPWSSLTQSVDVEMTAYSLLTYLQRGLVTEALPIMRWMVAQRNSNGGFASTQDTVIGLYALAKLAEKITVPNTNINVKIKHNTGAEGFSLSRENAMVLQKFKVFFTFVHRSTSKCNLFFILFFSCLPKLPKWRSRLWAVVLPLSKYRRLTIWTSLESGPCLHSTLNSLRTPIKTACSLPSVLGKTSFTVYIFCLQNV